MKYIEKATAMIKPIAATVGFSLPKNTQHRIAIIIGMQDKSAFNSFIVYLIISQIENKVIRLAF